MSAPDTFRASVQYGDWNGQCQADDGDFISIWDYMRGKSLIAPHEFLIGIKTFNGENLREGDVQPVIVHAFVITADKFDDARAYLEKNGPIETREVTFEMTVEEFAHHFKRFSMVLCPRNLNWLGRDYVANDD